MVGLGREGVSQSSTPTYRRFRCGRSDRRGCVPVLHSYVQEVPIWYIRDAETDQRTLCTKVSKVGGVFFMKMDSGRTTAPVHLSGIRIDSGRKVGRDGPTLTSVYLGGLVGEESWSMEVYPGQVRFLFSSQWVGSGRLKVWVP